MTEKNLQLKHFDIRKKDWPYVINLKDTAIKPSKR